MAEQKPSKPALVLTTPEGIVSYLQEVNDPKNIEKTKVFNKRVDEIIDANGGKYPDFWTTDVMTKLGMFH